MTELRYDAKIDTSGIRSDLTRLENAFATTDRRISTTSSRIARRGIQKKVREEERAADKASNERIRIERRIYDAKALMARRYARLQVRLEQQAAKEIQRAHEKSAQQSAAFRKRIVGRIGGTLGGLGRTALGVGAAGITALAGVGVRDRLAAGTAASSLANTAKAGGDRRSREDIRQAIMSASANASRKYGGNQLEGVQFMKAFQEMSGAVGDNLADQLIGLGKTRGVEDFSTLGNAAGIVRKSFTSLGMDGSKADDETLKLMRQFGNSSAAQQIGLENLARVLPQISSSASSMGGDPAENMKAVFDAMNIAVLGGASSAEEAATSSMRMLDDMVNRAKKEKLDVFDKSGNLRGMDVLKDVTLERTGGDLTKINSLLGVRGKKMMMTEARWMRDELASGKDKGAALAAVQRLRKENANAKDTDLEAQSKADIAFLQNDPAIKFQRSLEDLKMSFADELIPVLTQDVFPALKEAAPAIKELVSAVASVISWFSKNPGLGIATVITAAVAKDLAGVSVKKLIEDALSGKGGAGGAGGAGGVATLAAVAGVAAATAEGGALMGNIMGGPGQTGVGSFDSIGSTLANILPTGWALQAAGDISGGRSVSDSLWDTGGGKAAQGLFSLFGGDGSHKDDIAKKEAAIRAERAEIEAIYAKLDKLSGAADQAADKLNAIEGKPKRPDGV